MTDILGKSQLCDVFFFSLSNRHVVTALIVPLARDGTITAVTTTLPTSSNIACIKGNSYFFYSYWKLGDKDQEYAVHSVVRQGSGGYKH